MPENISTGGDEADEDITNESKPVKATGNEQDAASSDRYPEAMNEDGTGTGSFEPGIQDRDEEDSGDITQSHQVIPEPIDAGTSRETPVNGKPPLPISAEDLPDLRENGDDDEATQDPQLRRNRDEFTTVYDVIDELDSMVENAKSGIFSPNMAHIDRAEFSQRLGQLKTMLPVQLERASSLMREAERRLTNAQSQAKSIVSKAQSTAAQITKEAEEQAQFLAGHERVTQLAQERARTIVGEAQEKSEKLTNGANDYCIDVMKNLQEQLAKYASDVNNGLTVLKERENEASQRLSTTQRQTLSSEVKNRNGDA
ncbi:hypothetical protein [Bifidobacterium bombi]|uniref:Cell division initiation protein n=1 Tax=Bifidobacterium bombi DSM 19703 TaxID=1341695 RepID=A0A080N314_9BIFI|nr:hypothetical protein [Bifidobacterium bombi]KFF31467.1 hypothetical protein BBOMB_0829 [Bifidobacterium bombi DSM 19703]